MMRSGSSTWHRAFLVAALVALTILGPAATADATPKPAFKPQKPRPLSLLMTTDQLQAGSRGQIAIRATRLSVCRLQFAGPHHLRSAHFRVTMRRPFATWRWRVPATVRGGVWKARVSCRRGGHSRKRVATILVAVSRANRHSLVAKHSMKVSLRRATPLPGGDRVSGKGGGGYPNDDARCKWTGRHDGPCTNYDWGYLGRNNVWSVNSGRGFGYRNCTDFVAWFMGLTWAQFHFPARHGNAVDWKASAHNVGLEVTSHPSVGDIAWWGAEKASGYGHVAVVTAVNASGSVTIAEYNGDGQGHYDLRPNMRADAYLHRPAPAPQPTAPTTPPPTGGGGGGGGPSPTPTPTPTPAPKTWAEQQGHHGVNTFLNPHNASGMGPKIQPAQWVDVSCKVYAPEIASANPDGYWYRIASSPWNNAYYSPANTFMNGDPWNGPYTHNTDFAVPNC